MKKLMVSLILAVVLVGAGSFLFVNVLHSNDLFENIEFGIFLFPKDGQDLIPVNTDLLVTKDDVEAYDFENRTFKLTDAAVERLDTIYSAYGVEHTPQMGNGLYGRKFAIVVGGKTVVTGAFWTSVSSQSYEGPVLMDSMMFPFEKKFRLEAGYTATGKASVDDSAIRNYFEGIGKLVTSTGNFQIR